MKKSVKIIIAVILCVVIVALAIALPLTLGNCNPQENSSSGTNTSESSSEGPKVQKYDPNSRPVVFSLGTPDGNFNPFFSTSAYDSSVIGLTQISMLSVGRKGKPAYGENEPCVALDYSEKKYTEENEVTQDGEKAERTEYEFVIKNGIKFSDGENLTILDVLFNLYVYLDPAYVGSSTIYSTDIRGLNAYRAQDPDLADDSNADYSSGFYVNAMQRVRNIVDFVSPQSAGGYGANDQRYLNAGHTQAQLNIIKSDIEATKVEYKKELESLWNSNAGGLEGYKEDYYFTEDWQSYYLNTGVISTIPEQNEFGATVRKKKTITDDEGVTREVYMTSLDQEDSTHAEEIEDYVSEKLNKYMQDHNCDEAYARQQLIREKAIDVAFEANATLPSSIADILTYWNTSVEMIEKFAGEERSSYYDNIIATGGMQVETISGITTYRTDNFNGKALGEEHEVLKIVINRVDPKAVWNFAFTVAPMHYYSTADQIEKAKASYAKYISGEEEQITSFGVNYSNSNFFNEGGLKDPDKSGVPVGAGTYMASCDSHKQEDVTRHTFYEHNVVYYEANPYFYTVGKELHNANIKYLNYQVVSEDGIMNALLTEAIDFGEPGATQKNLDSLDKVKSYLSYKQTPTNGYGYVGINPKFVKELEVRQAIMKSFDVGKKVIADYYRGGLAEQIYRPMSKQSWAYPFGCTEYPSIAYYGGDEKQITDLVESAGYKKNSNGKYEKNGKDLKFTFTIAGETTDHPAYAMFVDAKAVLERCGFTITIKQDVQALTKLATGGLEVWAAAWSAAIDPDMYQVYHKDSTATSTKNWYYSGIMNTDEYPREKATVEELSKLIEQARETINEKERIVLYSQALDLVMDLAVEFPTYQRKNLNVYNSKIIDSSTLEQNPDNYVGLTTRIWEINYN